MRPELQTGTEAAFYDLLAAAILEPDLRSILAFDTDESELLRLSDRFAQAIEIGRDLSVKQIILDSATTEENLWGHFVAETKDDNKIITWQPSAIVRDEPLLVVIPDLTRLSLAAARACVSLLGSSSATLQRHGMDLTWKPQFWCLAGCLSDRIGEVSPHLLDRFALRVTPPVSLKSLELLSPIDRFRRLNGEEADPKRELPQFASDKMQQIRALLAANDLPELTAAASDRILAYFKEETGKLPPGMRRPLTLAKLARARSRFIGETEISVKEVDLAAALVGLQLTQKGESIPPTEEPINSVQNPIQSDIRRDSGRDSLQDLTSDETSVETEREVVKPNVESSSPPTVTPVENVPPAVDPYCEDESAIAHELEPLKIPVAMSQSLQAGYGDAIGTQPATDFEDISLYGTIFEAAKFQGYRKRFCGAITPSFLIWFSDLRSHRRSPQPQHLLLCAIDFTCLEGRNWQKAIAPHFQDWAYVNRASIGIIRIGAKDAQHRLRADWVEARSMLSSEISLALKGEAGRGTPLAHGLEMAGDKAKRALQHGRSRVDRVRLVVLTDGRGNIPLEASKQGKLKSPVSREGIDDALAVARELAKIPRLEIVLLDPQPALYPALPKMFARDLGAVVREVDRLPLPAKEEVAENPQVLQEAVLW